MSRALSNKMNKISDTSYSNARIVVGDITGENVGKIGNQMFIFDPRAYYKKDIKRTSNAKFKRK